MILRTVKPASFEQYVDVEYPVAELNDFLKTDRKSLAAALNSLLASPTFERTQRAISGPTRANRAAYRDGVVLSALTLYVAVLSEVIASVGLDSHVARTSIRTVDCVSRAS